MLAHPLGVAVGQVIVDRDDVDALAFERVEVTGRVATSVFPSPVFISAILPRCRTMPPINCTSKWRMLRTAAAGFADHGEGFDQQVVEGRALGQLLFELDGFGGQVDIGELLHGGSRSLMAATMGRMALISRLFLVPKTLARALSNIKTLPSYLFQT